MPLGAHLVPESCVQQVQYGMLRPSDVQVHGHPVLLLLGVDELPGVGRVNEAEVVPAGPSPLGHRRGLPGVGHIMKGLQEGF